MAYNSPYGSTIAYKSAGKCYYWRRTPWGPMLCTLKQLKSKNSISQRANRARFAMQVSVAQHLRDNPQSIFSPSVPLYHVVDWNGLIRYIHNDGAFAYYGFNPLYFEFVSQYDAEWGLQYNPAGFALVGLPKGETAWYCLGGHVWGDGVQYPWVDLGKEFERVIAIFGLEHHFTTGGIVTLIMHYNPGNASTELRIQLPPIYKSAPRSYSLVWGGWPLKAQGWVDVPIFDLTHYPFKGV